MNKIIVLIMLSAIFLYSCGQSHFAISLNTKKDYACYSERDSILIKDKAEKERLNNMKNLSNQDSLTSFAFRERNAYIRGMAVSRISDQVSLECIALFDPDPRNRIMAFSRINAKTILLNVRFKEKDENVIRFMEQKFSNDSPLKTIPGFVQSEDIDQQRITLSDSDPNHRIDAVKRLTTQNFIEHVAIHDSIAKVREVAVTRLIGKAILQNLSHNDINEQVRLVALSRLGDIKAFLSNKNM